MKNMTLQELYDYLNSPEFQDVKSGNIFYNYYIYQYSAAKEYEIQRQIVVFKQNLERPSSFINAMLLDLFQVFCDYLKTERFGPDSLFDVTLEDDKTQPNMVTQELTTEANSDNFIHYVHGSIFSMSYPSRAATTPLSCTAVARKHKTVHSAVCLFITVNFSRR